MTQSNPDRSLVQQDENLRIYILNPHAATARYVSSAYSALWSLPLAHLTFSGSLIARLCNERIFAHQPFGRLNGTVDSGYYVITSGDKACLLFFSEPKDAVSLHRYGDCPWRFLMKKSLFSAAILVSAYLIINGCSRQAETEREADNEASASDAKDAAEQSLTKAGQSAEAVAAEVVQAARLSVTATKLAVTSAVQNDKEAAMELASKAAAAAQRAEEKIKATNSEIVGTVDENAKKAESLARASVAATGEAFAKAKASVEAGAKSDAAAAKTAALDAEQAAIKASAAAVEASKAATAAAKETWKKEMNETNTQD
jgi:hypothetical protein